MGGVGSGKKKKVTVLPIVRVKTVTLDPVMGYGEQLRKVRLFYGLSLSEMSDLSGWSVSNCSHFESPKSKTGFTGKLSGALTYAEALGIEEVRFRLKPKKL